MKKVLASVFLFTLFLSGYTEVPGKYIPKSDRKKEKLATAEPGTYLKPAALMVLKRMTRVMEESTVKEPAPCMLNLFTPSQKKLVDTTLLFNEVEIPVRIYYPTRESLQGHQPACLFFHGGGFVLGSVEQYHIMASKLARMTGQIIVSVDYRLAPDHPFPAAIKDCYSAFQSLLRNGSSLGIDTTRISVMGDSAGGNLATVVTLMCRDKQTPQPRCQVLLYPAVTFVDREYPSINHFLKNADRSYVLSEAFLKRVRNAYKGTEGRDDNPYISPLEAELSNDLAPALIIAAECDPLRDSDKEYAHKLEAAGVKAEYLEYSGMIHGFMSFQMILGDAVDAMRAAEEFLGEN
ncbi:MAG: alpha/beta hydrolase [Bacteroidales bacterium]|nr:alpha/beta hydrolase [Bacteroidales bacterium]